MKTDQADCAYFDALDQTDPAKTTKKKSQATKTSESVKSAVKDVEIEMKEATEAEILNEEASSISDAPKVIAESTLPHAVETVPERILKIAEATKEESADNENKLKQENVHIKEENIAESAKEEQSEHPKETEKTV